MHRGRVIGIGCGVAAVLMVGCGGNNSNPELALTSARVFEDRAELSVLVTNGSAQDLELTGIDYELVYGPLPVGSGSWSGSEAIASGKSASVQLEVELDGPVMDPSADTVTLTGEMEFGGGSGGAGNEMAIKGASFESTASVKK